MTLFIIAVSFVAGCFLTWKLHDVVSTDLAAVMLRVAALEAKAKAVVAKV